MARPVALKAGQAWSCPRCYRQNTHKDNCCWACGWPIYIQPLGVTKEYDNGQMDVGELYPGAMEDFKLAQAKMEKEFDKLWEKLEKAGLT